MSGAETLEVRLCVSPGQLALKADEPRAIAVAFEVLAQKQQKGLLTFGV